MDEFSQLDITRLIDGSMIGASGAKSSAAIEAGLTDPKKVLGSALHGINFLNTGINASNNTDLQGITFFTRPFLNLSTNNIKGTRKLTSLLTEKDYSIHKAIRRILDTKMSKSDDGPSTPLMDTDQAFIPIFTNLLTGISGWPDETMDMYVSEPGLRNEVYMLVDHNSNRYGSYDLTATFRNIDGDPINAILNVWLTYAKGVSTGSLLPYPEMMVNRIIDYETRIYRLVLDTSRRWIQKIACCGAAVPTANPLGTAFNFSSDTPVVSDTTEQSVPFKVIGYCYNDPIIIRDFNTTVGHFNKKMVPGERENKMVMIPPKLYPYFNYRCYPRISEDMELQWWCSKDIFYNVINKLGFSLSDDYFVKWFKGTTVGERNVA